MKSKIATSTVTETDWGNQSDRHIHLCWCIWVRLRIYVSWFGCVCVDMCLFMCVHICLWICVYTVYMRVCLYVYVYMYILYSCVFVCLFVCSSVCVYLLMCICVYMYVFVFVFVVITIYLIWRPLTELIGKYIASWLHLSRYNGCRKKPSRYRDTEKN